MHYAQNCCYVNGYVGVLAPTGNRPRARVMFEPIVGHNRHVGFAFGSLMSYDIFTDCDRALSWEVNLDSLYLFKGRETRSFDLKGHGPWSRYLLVTLMQLTLLLDWFHLVSTIHQEVRLFHVSGLL